MDYLYSYFIILVLTAEHSFHKCSYANLFIYFKDF